MADDPAKARLQALEARIARVKAAHAPRPAAPKSAVGHGEVAWRMVIELVAGIAIGFGIGYGLDVLFGTMPVFLVLFVLLGFAAGVKVMLRTALELQIAGGEVPSGAGPAADEGGPRRRG